jgi:hypothetical protein
MFKPDNLEKPLGAFKSRDAAAARIGMNANGITEVCHGRQKTCGGYFFRQITQEQYLEYKKILPAY